MQELVNRLESIGFIPIEVPALVTDMVRIARGHPLRSIDAVNQELEDLGWGIRILDGTAYGLLISLVHRNTSIPAVRRWPSSAAN